jgi:hypothetical protein
MPPAAPYPTTTTSTSLSQWFCPLFAIPVLSFSVVESISLPLMENKGKDDFDF